MSCVAQLRDHVALGRRRERSESQIDQLRTAFEASAFLSALPIAVFSAGSLARREAGSKSDLDLFVTADQDERLDRRLCQYKLMAELIRINTDLDFPEFSNDGQYLKTYFVEDLKKMTGSPQDDSENLFTTRMLLLLESEPLLHPEIHARHLRSVLEHYYRDKRGQKTFRPLFLLNDLLRYWRTLCLNYEERRHDPSKPWRKKNVNLKFSRMVTVFSTVLPLVVHPQETIAQVVELSRKTPLERLAAAIDLMDDSELVTQWQDILNSYEAFLGWKEDDDVEHHLESGPLKQEVQRRAEQLSTYLYSALTHPRIQREFRRYLIL